ncbi:hypothetical protein BDP27DRAFT_1443022 [Rhodocollybia butyracea]|uniref:Mid2 domain-containing protein n=1 Tax=Rhodocollybia butyracea TaxID=206335 RepID=A0A9P5UDZ5_9AGAR|nr:hypothetical protein BDP27DRAFT_1443022 [Rhodocollybia butyracea]
MAIILLVIAFNIASALSQTAVTLFEFGPNRFAGGVSTLPLVPLGTASVNSQTTYLYRVLSLRTTTNGVPTLTTVSRTIVASASGWAELFTSTPVIQCRFIDSTEGECFGGAASTATGAPERVVFKVASTTTIPATSTTNTSSPSKPTALPNSTTTNIPTSTNVSTGFQDLRKSRSSVGTIIGSTIAGVAVLLAVVFFILWRRRKRSRRQELDSNEIHPPMRTAGNVHPYLVATDTIPSQKRINFNSGQTRSKNAPANPQSTQELLSITDVVGRLRRLEEISLVSDEPPPSYTT